MLTAIRSPNCEDVIEQLEKSQIKVLLLENISHKAQNILKENGFNIEFYTKSLDEATLIEKIRDVHIIGIRSKTQLTRGILKHAKNLLTIGCFCIGTNQVDLNYSTERGITVFNSPFSNSRSVAELTIGNMIHLARQTGDRNRELHEGNWQKISQKCYEIRGKTLGIIGYGHIGSQLSVLAEAMGCKVIFYDIINIMAIGSAYQCPNLKELLNKADFVTLHVPETPDTLNLISKEQISQMKDGAYLINASRGTVVDIEALAEALKSKKLGGAAIDVYPNEPESNGIGFKTPLQGCPNTILSPHIGGSTEEAQALIGLEVAGLLASYILDGTSIGSVNFPKMALKYSKDPKTIARVSFIHSNVPGVLKAINNVLADHNVESQICQSLDDLAYLMADIRIGSSTDVSSLIKNVNDVQHGILSRILI